MSPNRSQWPAVSSQRNRDGRFAVNLFWLFKLRWVAVIGQFLTIAFVVYILEVQVMIWPLAIILAVTTVSNLFLWVWFRYWQAAHHPRQEPDRVGFTEYSQTTSVDQPDSASEILVLGLVMTLDMLSLTSLLYTTGGPTNPFNFFFFVNLSLSAVVLTRRWSWALNFLSILCFAFLIYDHVPIQELGGNFLMEGVRSTGKLGIPHAGALVAFSTCSSVIVYFMTRLTGELRLQERELGLAQVRQAQGEKLEALGTLAAGAAHELATPLSTIAIVAREVESQVEQGAPQSEIAEDVRLIRSELDRCRTILDQMSADAGQAIGESFTLVTVGRLLDEVLAELPVATGLANESAVKVELSVEIKQRQLRVPLATLAKAIRGLIKNAVDASRELPANNRNSPGDPIAAQLSLARLVEVHGYQREGKLCIEIRDYGVGMIPEVMRRISEPFFTTKPVGKGMGLGVFLARSIVLRIDGQIVFDSQPGKGTTAKVMLELC